MSRVANPLLAAAVYVVLGVLWIVFTDVLVQRVASEVAQVEFWQTAKGWLYVVLSGGLVYLLALQASRREAMLLERDKELTAITNALPGPVARLDREGRYRFANAACRKWFGQEPAAMLGRMQPEVLGPDVYARLEPSVRRVRRGESVQYVGPVELPDGETRWALVLLIPDHDETHEPGGHFTITLDITERYLAEQARTLSERRYARLIESAPEAILVDRGGAIILANDASLRLFGAERREQLLGKTPYDLFHPDDHAVIDTRRRQMLGSEVALPLREGRIVRLDGSPVDVDVSVSTFMDGDQQAIHVILRDITRRKQAEAELHQMNSELEARVVERTEQLRQALERAETADRVKSAFLASMSHELRTPLNSIIGFTGILLQGLPGPLTGEQHRQLGIVRDASRHLLALINDILDISKIEAGQLQIAREPFDLRASVLKVADLIRPLAEAKGLELDVNVDPAISRARGDARRVQQILMNLLGNAVKFTEHGRVTLSARCAHREQPCRTALLCVADTGIGIAEEHLPRLFEPFHQVASSHSTQEGTGLGLAIAGRLAHLMDGEIRVRSVLHEGSEFSVSLPIRTEETG